MKRIVSLLLTLSMALVQPLGALAMMTDTRILSDPIQNTYEGRVDGTTMIHNVNFADVPSAHWASESIARATALGLISGYNRNFRPGAAITNEEALAMVIDRKSVV